MVEAAIARAELLERARDLLPMVLERAEANERLRQVSPDVVEALVGSGLIRAAQPERFGGMGLDFDVTFELGMELSRACGSTGWCYAIWSSHNWLVGMFPLEAQEEYWADGPDTLSSTSFNPARGVVEAADWGYRVSGRWDFSSGCDPATWVMPIGNAPEGPALLMLPRADYRIDDNWFVVGLKGSGSKDIVVDGAFVPRHRAVSMEDVREGTTPGRKIHDTPNYRIPMRSILSYTLAASVLGMAQGGVEAFAENIQGQVSGRTGGKFTDSAGLQLRLAESDAELRAAEALLKHDCAEIFGKARASEEFSLEERAKYRRNQAYIARLSVQAIDRVFAASGGRALFESHPLQRFYRDVHAAAHHVSLAWDAPAEQFGKVRLGLELERPDL